MTGDSPDLETLERAKEFAPGRPVLVGSGADERNIRDFLRIGDGVIVGTSLKYDGICENPVDPDRVKRFVEIARQSS